MRGGPSLVLSGLLLQRIFDNNQEEFTKAEPRTIPTIAVLEEAQSVLGSAAASDGPYVSWVKEGRKYDLGAVLVTQQPGSITTEILSQGDNWFIFHLLSAADLVAVKRANAHFSDDILSTLLNEPIPGQGVFWTSVAGKSYPVPFRAMSFEHAFTARDPEYSEAPAETYAVSLRNEFYAQLSFAGGSATQPDAPLVVAPDGAAPVDQPIDALDVYVSKAIDDVRTSDFAERVRERGIPWRGAMQALIDRLPPHLDRTDDVAYNAVARLLDDVLGRGGWETEKRPRASGTGTTTWIVATDDSAAARNGPDGEIPF